MFVDHYQLISTKIQCNMHPAHNFYNT